MEILNSIVNKLACPSCEAVNMNVSEIYSKKKDLLLCLFFQCHSCSYFIESYTSRSVGNSFDINTRAVYSTRPCGQGYVGFEKFVSLMNLPKPMTSNNYDKIVNKLIDETTEELRGDSTGIVDTSRSELIDSAWVVIVPG